MHVVKQDHISWPALSAAAACSTGVAVGVGTILLATFSLFLGPISAEFGWGRTVLAGALSVAGIVQMFFSPLWGRAIDRFGARFIALPGILITGGTLMALSTINSSIPRLYILLSIVSILSGAAGGVAYPKVISAWYRGRRGLALGVFLGGGSGIAIAILVPLAHHLIASDGWRHAYFILGLLPIVIGFPIFALWLREPANLRAGSRRRTVWEGAAAEATDHPGISSSQALRSRQFWLLNGALFLNALAFGGFRAHAVGILTDRGYPDTFAVIVLSTIAISSVVGQIGVGFVLDRFSTPWVGVPVFLAALIGLLMLNGAAAPAFVVIAGAAVLGCATGAEHSVGPYFTSRFFGLRSFGEIQGYMTMATGAGFSISPVLMGFMFDASGSYRWALYELEFALAASALMVGFLGAYRFPAK